MSRPLRPELPKTLLDQLSSQPNGKSYSRRSDTKRTVSGRKAHRKTLRNDRKAARHSNTRPSGPNVRRNEIDEDSEEDDDEENEETPPPAKKQKITEHKQSSKPLKSILKKPTKDADQTPSISRVAREALEEDDARISKLEKRLGIRKNKKSGMNEIDDLLGLDGVGYDSDGESAERREYEQWLASKRQAQEDAEPDQSQDSELESDSGNLEASEDDEDGLEDGFEDSDVDQDVESEVEPPVRQRENPYKPPIPEPAQKYIPPSLRAKSTADEESLSRLKRQLQGSLNKLAESNLLGILRDVEEALANNPRQHVITVMIDLLVSLLADRSSHPDSFIILHAAFISAVYRVLGPHFGAQLLENMVNTVSAYYDQQKADYASSKECNNLMALLAELYAFQVINSNLIFDYLKIFLNDLSEYNTELILKIMRNCGPQLRKDDPGSLKDIVILLQTAVAKQGGEATLSVRTKFMIETIIDLKNNKTKSRAGTEGASQQIVRMKKTLGTLSGRSFQMTEPLGVGLKDIQTADKTGKWWLVGASWKSKEPEPSHERHVEDVEVADAMELDGDDGENLWEEAIAQGMNNDVKRSIFVAIQSSVDYHHALIQLRQIRLKAKQQLEIPGVLLHIAGSTETYSSFYGTIAQHLCREHKYRKAFQFSLWTIYRKLGEQDLLSGNESEYRDDSYMNMRRIVSVGKFYGELVAAGSLPITILKVCLNFTLMFRHS
jgi:nucleolar MIF4G domain-containing protein 1